MRDVGTRPVPEVIISDNGPQYDCQSYKQFSKEWASNIQSPAQDTHSPTGFLSDKSRLLKNTSDKAVKSREDPHMSMLCLRSTPIDSQLPYPAELRYKRKL